MQGSNNTSSTTETRGSQAALIQEELAKVLASPFFAQSRRLQAFLAFLVNAALRGDAGELKESVIAAEVYGRGGEFDPRVDSIVRTEALRLRNRLEKYYASQGSLDRVRFELPKGGYVLRVEVGPVPAGGSVDVAIAKAWWVAKSAFGLAILVTLSVCVWLYASLRHRQPPKTPAITVLSDLPGYQLHPSLSPDGKKLAFVWNGNGSNYDIYVKAINGEAPRRLTTDEAQDLNPAWSPDGKQIAFFRASATKKQIFVIPASGGTERNIAVINPVAVPWVQEASIMRRTPGPAWSPDGQWLAITDRCGGQNSADCIYLLSLDGLQRRRITSGAAIGDYAPTFAPDGKRIAFLRVVADMGIAEVYTQEVNGNSERRLTSDGNIVSSVTWGADGRIFFVSKRSGNNLLWSIPEFGGDPQLVSGIGGQVYFPAAAARVNEVAYTQYYRNVNIWRTGLAKGSGSELLIGSSRVNHSPQYSPDGRRIVYFSDRSGQPEIWIANSDGSDSRRLTVSSAYRLIGSPNWSPDGKQLVYDAVATGRSQIYLMDPDGAGQKQFTTDPGEAMMPTWSRDGHAIYYVARRNGTLSLWKKQFGGGDPLHIADGVVSDALETPDGRRVFFSKSAPGIWEASSNGGDERVVPELAAAVHSRYCFTDLKGIYFLAQAQPPWDIHFFDLATRKISSIATILRTPEFNTRSLSISPDGKWMLHAQVDQIGSAIMMVAEN